MTELVMRTNTLRSRASSFKSLRARAMLLALAAAGVVSAVTTLAALLVLNWPLAHVDGWVGRAALLFGVVFALSSVVALVVSYAITMPATRRLREAARVARAVAEGDYAQRTNFASSDEIGALGRSLDVVAGRLQERSRQEGAVSHRHDAELTRLSALLASMHDGVVMLDRHGRIVTINDAARQMLGSEERFWSSDAAKLVERLDLGRALGPQLGARKPVRIADRQGCTLQAEASVVSTLNGEELGVLVVIRDVTRETLTTQLKNQFIAQVSHELRTPLTAIKGAGDVLAETLPPHTPGYRFLGTISRNVALLDGIIGDLLDVADMLAGTFAVRGEPVLLEPLLWEALDVYKPRFDAAGLELQTYVLDARLRVSGDARRLRWTLCHLLDNALKHTLRGGSVTVTLGELIYGHAVIDVTDTGVGIGPRDLPHIFEPYYRGEPVAPDSQRLTPAGLGLGLFVARAVAEAHGGSLTVVSEVGKGATFSLVLPPTPG